MGRQKKIGKTAKNGARGRPFFAKKNGNQKKLKERLKTARGGLKTAPLVMHPCGRAVNHAWLHGLVSGVVALCGGLVGPVSHGRSWIAPY